MSYYNQLIRPFAFQKKKTNITDVLWENKEEAYIYIYNNIYNICNNKNRMGGVMVSVLALSAVDREFEPRSEQTKDYKTDIFCFSAKHAALRR